jgi:cyclin-dependent kinase 2
LDAAGIDLLQRMLVYVPQQRITATAALQHPFFSDLTRVLAAQQQQQP